MISEIRARQTDCDVLELTKRLVVIPSSAADAAGAWPEAGVAQAITDYAAAHGLTVESIPVTGSRKNLLLRYPFTAATADKTVLLAGHMDTVNAGGMPDAFCPRVEGERLYGRGACDTKGPVAVALTVLCDLARRKVELPTRVLLVCTVDEETGMSGARACGEALEAVDAIIALEPTSLEVVNAHKGVLRFQVTTHGKSAHSAHPERGENAILKMLPLAEELRRFGEQEVSHPVLGRRTLAITEINGGIKRNIIPDSCVLGVDMRTLPADDATALADELRAMLGERAELMIDFCGDGIETPPSLPWVQKLLGAVEAHGVKGTLVGVAYCTDCAFLRKLGPCVVWGPGSIGQAHSDGEYIEIAQLEQACQILEEFLHG